MGLPLVSMGKYDIISLEGEVKVSSLITMTTQLNKHLEEFPEKNLVLDLSNTSFIDSSALRLFINLKKRLDSNSRFFYLLKPSEPVLKIICDTNLDKQFGIITDVEELETKISLNAYDTFLPYTIDDNGQKKVTCTCAVCGSSEVDAYLINQNDYDWKWIGEDLFPTSFAKGSDTVFDIFSLSTIVCTDCYMCSTELSDFHMVTDKKIGMRAQIDENSKMLLSKSIKKRKKMMELSVATGDNFFKFPRDKLASYQSYVLAEACSRNMAVNKQTSNPFIIGWYNYLALQYADTSVKDEHINNCRTWCTQAINDKESFNHIQRAKAYFILFVASLTLDKAKDASKIFTDFGELIESLPKASLTATGINSPEFWFNQLKKIWQKEIENKSNQLKI